MEKVCGTCKWWDRGIGKKYVGDCGSPKWKLKGQDFKWDEVMVRDEFWTTGKYFGCIHWEEQDDSD
jgi:hypothetical protein